MTRMRTAALAAALLWALPSASFAAEKAHPATKGAAKSAPKSAPTTPATPAATEPGATPSATETSAAPSATAASGGEAVRQWAKGVSPDEQRVALSLFREGNALLKESVFVQAAAKYRDALRHWDHPAIHYNLVLALLNLDQPLEVREHLIAALKYGPEPLDQEKFEQAKAYKVLVERQLARVEIRCEEPGAQVVMDGRSLFVAPGKYEDFVRPGPHTIVASKAGFLNNQLSKALPAGELSTFEVKLFKAEDLTHYRRRWSQAIPWTVLVAGVVVGGAGGGLHYGAAQSFASFDKSIADNGGGSNSDPALMSKRNNGVVMQDVAITCYGVGGAALVAGAVLVYLNRLTPFQEAAPGPADGKKKDAADWAVSPILGPDTQGVAATVRF